MRHVNGLKLAGVGLAALLVSVAGSHGPAEAGSTTGAYGTLAAADASAFDNQCVNEHEQLTVTSPADISNTGVTITGPGGTAEYGSFDGGGAGTVELCGGSDPAGTYEVHLALYDDDDNYLGALDTTFEFNLNKPVLKASVKKLSGSKYGRRGYQMSAALTVHRKPWKNKVVLIQVQIKGFWFNLPGADLKKRTNNQGKAFFTAYPKRNAYAFRFDVASTAKAPEVSSKPFRLPYYR